MSSGVTDALAPEEDACPAALMGSEHHILTLRVERLSTKASDIPR